MLFMAHVPYLALESENELVKDSTLAILFVVGLLAAVFCASNTLAREIRTGTALAVLAKPVSRVKFLLAKYVGVSFALFLVVYVNLMAALLTSRVIPDFADTLDPPGLFLFLGGMLLGILLAGYTNFFQHRQFVGDAVMGIVAFTTLGFLLLNFLDRAWQWQSFADLIDWRILGAGILIMFAVLVLGGIALACSTRLEMIPTLAICAIFFMIGLMTDYIFGRAAAEGSMIAQVLYAVFPNWQLFWMVDAIEGETNIPVAYLVHAFIYVVCYLTATLSIAAALFEDRELA
ncbi:MAG: hypothetical protein CMO80_21685 [Verrucomicrobiales bacterium]|nr:hypothetical protein [Verrucomicrobiales bacterium]|tara:strand:- start:5360 stop:6226 length:867 start_codon:yes stop_codon:yes gene_type:complete